VGLAVSAVTWPLWFGIAFTGLTILAALRGAGAAAILVTLIAGTAALIFLIIGVTIPISRHYDRVACEQFREQTGRTARFVVYHTFSWTCLVRTADGRWLPREQLREFGEDAP
jgi:hypothetical protein